MDHPGCMSAVGHAGSNGSAGCDVDVSFSLYLRHFDVYTPCCRGSFDAAPPESSRWSGFAQENTGHVRPSILCEKSTPVHVRGIADRDFGNVFQRAPSEFAADAGRLEVAFQNCQHLVSDLSFLAICASSPGLRHIDLSGCLLITDKALAIVATLCPLVEWISVSKCPLVTERGLLFLASSLPRLVHLDASRCRGMTDRSLAAIASHCPRLQSLCLAYCTELTDAGLAALAAAWAQPAPADARAYGPPVHGATRGSQVSHLDLSGCAQVSADALDLLLPHVTRVACLRLACLPCMGDAQLATAAAAAGASLQEVDVSGCPLVTDAGVRALALLSGPDGLRSVAVAGCEVTDAGIAALAEECVHLVYVDARGCPQLLGWEAASALGRWGQGVGWGGGVAGCLRSLDVRGCPGWDPDVCAYLARLCPLLALVTGGGASLSAHPLVARGVVRSHPDMHLVHGSGRETCREGTVVGRSQSPPFVMSGRKRCHEEETAGSGSCTSDGPSSPRQRLMWRSADVCRRRDAGALPSDVALSPRQHSHEADEPCLLSMTPATSPPVSACGPHGRGGIPVFSSPCCPMCYGGGAHPGPWEVWSRPVEDVGPLVAGTHAVMRDVSQSAPNTALGVGARFSDSTLARAHLWGAVVR